jgi:hypothetical protein
MNNTMRFQAYTKRQNGFWRMDVTDTKSGHPVFTAFGMPGELSGDFMNRANREWDEARTALLKWENR